MRETSTQATEVDVRRVLRLWLPLAASWLLMAMEPTLVIAAVSRMPDETVNLGAWNSVVFPVSLVCEGPIIMMLAATTRLASSWQRYAAVMRYGHIMGAALTLLHGLIAFTPLYDVVAVDILGSKEAVIEPGRLGLQIMLPWTFAIGYRRAQQGTLIRFERSAVVTQGTLLRLIVTGAVLFGLRELSLADEGPLSGLSGVGVAALGVAAGVMAEAVFAGVRVREVWPALRAAKDTEPPMAIDRFARFYGPLALTPLITLLIQPIGAASMNRMPRPLENVAAWGPIHALVFKARSVGMAFNEVVVTLVALPGGAHALKRFGWRLALGTSAFVALVAFTPLAKLWFGTIESIPPSQIPIATVGIGCAVLMPAYQVAQSWFQGLLVSAERTRPITEAVLLYFAVAAGLLYAGTKLAEPLDVLGVAWTVCSFMVAGLCQTAWLWRRAGACYADSEAVAAR